MAPANTRRWPRHQVKLPVRIIRANDISEITVPGLTTEISRGGMALYGGVPLQPGDLMEVEFQTSSRLRVAASVRDRIGYCFGLEFVGLLPSEGTEDVGADFAETAGGPGDLAESLTIGAGVQRMEDGTSSPAAHVQVVQAEDEILALFLERHEAYLHQKEFEIKRLRHEIQEIRQSRMEIELLVLRQVLGRSD
ncbi:MAG TPA: PilZ domain-containing protein [Terriglobales bacterium]|nr:PilZ domain-containing protein [Terriglobales bacterium]